MTVRIADRKRTIAAIHVLAGQLGMDTADKNPSSEYRATLYTIGRAWSCNDLDFTALERVRAHLSQLVKARGLDRRDRLHVKRAKEWSFVDTAAADRRPMLRKIIMLLKSSNRPKEYVDGIAFAMFKIERLELCGPSELHSIISALVKDQQRRNNRGGEPRQQGGES